jgi:hypothetical protein
MTEQNRKYVTKEIGKLLSEIWRIKGLAEQEYGPQHPITKKLSSMYVDAEPTHCTPTPWRWRKLDLLCRSFQGLGSNVLVVPGDC